MDAPFSKASVGGGGGVQNHNRAPFDKPKSMGNGGIPEKFYDAMSATPAKTVNAGGSAPSSHGQQSVTQRRFKT
jgi:hypothetical protein